MKLLDKNFRYKDVMVTSSSSHTLHDRVLRLVTLVETVTRIRIIVIPAAPSNIRNTAELLLKFLNLCYDGVPYTWVNKRNWLRSTYCLLSTYFFPGFAPG